MANLRIAELDFDAIKTNLKTFLQSQSEFTDYDFEGSSLSVLIDLLAYNTHYNAYLANMLMNEMFLDSAVKRSSAASIAKHLGYTPRSKRSSTSSINVVVNNPTNLPPTLFINKFTQFTSSVNGTSYTFSTIQDYSAERSGTSYTFNNLNIVEGIQASHTFVVADTTPDGKYEIPALDIDTTTLSVEVQNSISDLTSYTYNLATDITGKTSESKIYFLELSPLGKYQIYFGDGIIGKQLVLGNIINLRFLRSSGSSTNVSSLNTQTFTAASTIGGSSDITITVNSNSSGAKDEESITSIKYNASKINAAKNRAVTADDYEALILANYSGAESVAVWGGEDNDPPIYGKVLVSLKPATGFTIPQYVKDNIKNIILNDKKIISSGIDFIDPSYIFITTTCAVQYNPSLTTLGAEGIKSTVLTTIENFFDNELGKFYKTFFYSKLVKNILNSDNSILNAIITIKLQKRILPTLGISNTFLNSNTIKFRNPIKPGGITSSYFYLNVNTLITLCKIIDIPNESPPSYTGTGILRVLNVSNGSIVLRNIGSVHYSTGEVVINSLTPVSYPTNIIDIRINAEIQENYYTLTSARNEIFLQDDTVMALPGGYLPGTSISVTPLIT